MKLAIIVLFYFVLQVSQAQVGIGTTDPQEDLHIIGDLIVEGYSLIDNSTSLVGADDLGNLTILNLDNNLTLENNKLELSRSIYYGIGDINLSGIITVGGNLAHNVDLQLGTVEINEGKIVLNVTGLPSNIKITGIEDGVDGQHIFFYNSVTNNIVFLDESDPKSLGSLPQNRIKVLASSETLAGRGSVELIYDGNSQRWILISIHD
tara:strand:+ start:383 stop:1003 length:621 start_codon:yes stop_codon:yes gene_type:complete